VESFLNAVVAYFVMVDPVGVTLIFHALTADRTDAYARRAALRAVSISLLLVLLFGFWGEGFLRALGIQMESFKIAGGLLIFYAAFGMIMKPEGTPGRRRGEMPEDISVFPLAIPLIAGPGCLTLTVLLFSDARAHGQSILPLLAAVLAIYATTLLCFLFSKPLVRLAGQTVNNIFKRLLGVLLASLAIQFIADGAKGLFG